MGGLISLYGICEYPGVFGGAGCLSTHWPMEHQLFSAYLKARLPEPGQHKIYLDYGNEANSPGYRDRQKRVEHILKGRGYEPGIDWLSYWFVDDPHSETAWRTRIQMPLRFLLKNGQRPSQAFLAEPVQLPGYCESLHRQAQTGVPRNNDEWPP